MLPPVRVISAPAGQSRYVIELAPEVTASRDATAAGSTYDGARNITGAGADQYRYDTSNRLIQATVGGANNTMAYQ